MSLLHNNRRWSRKPPLNTQIQWGHPLAERLQMAYLFNEAGGTVVRDLALNADGVFTNSVTWSTDGLDGLSADFTGAGAGDYISISNALKDVSGAATTLVMSMRIRALGNSNVQTVFFGTATGSSAFWQFKMAGQVSIHSVDLTAPISSYVDGIWRTYVFVCTGSAGAFYVDGQLVVSGALAPTGFVSGQKTIRIGNWSGGSSWNLDGQIGFMYLYDRAFAAAEAQQISIDPYCIMTPAPRRMWFAPAAAAPSAGAMLIHTGAFGRR